MATKPLTVNEKILNELNLTHFFIDDISYGCMRSFCAERKQEKFLDVVRNHHQFLKLFEAGATSDAIKLFLTSKTGPLLVDPQLKEHITADDIFVIQKSISGNTFHIKTLDHVVEVASRQLNLSNLVTEWKAKSKNVRQFISNYCKMRLNDDFLIFYYEKFLAHEYSSENLDFYHTIKKYEALWDANEGTGTKLVDGDPITTLNKVMSARAESKKESVHENKKQSARENKERSVREDKEKSYREAKEGIAQSPRSRKELPPLNVEMSEEEKQAKILNRRRDAAFIINLYVAEDAPLQVNIPGNLRKEIEAYREGDKDPSKELFHKAWNDLYKMLVKDSWTRFKRSEHFKEYLESVEPTDYDGKTPSEYRRARLIKYIGSDPYEIVMASKIGRDCLNKFNQAIKPKDGTIDFLYATVQYSREGTRSKALDIFKNYLDPAAEDTCKMDVTPDCLARIQTNLQKPKMRGDIFDEAVEQAMQYIEKNKIFERFKMTSLYTKYRLLSKQMS